MQKNVFDLLFDYILIVEGGYSNDKYDKGGKTKYGIIESIARKHNLDVKTLTKEDAKEIYYQDYYLKNKIDRMKNKKIALSVFDWCVNSGSWGIKKAQQTLNELGYNLTVDGIVGIKTLHGLNSVDYIDFLKLYHQKQREFYNKIVKNNPTQKVFLKGWLNRVSRKEEFLSNVNLV